MKKKLWSILLLLTLCLSQLSGSALAAPDSDIVVLYTNDIHTYIDNNIGEGNDDGLTYSKVAALKDSYDNALLVDAGDHIQGTAYGQMDSGKSIINLMNAAEYDLATLGNHEFDYGQTGRIRVTDEWAAFDYVSCNFYREENGAAGKNVLDSYKIFEVNGMKIAFVGITTPETITSSAPSYFQDEDGNYIYGIAAGADGSDLYAAVQTAINGAKADGADYVIALGHLGVDLSSEPWTSRNVIANTTGLDAFIDGHSHTTVEMELVADREKNGVVLTQTGSYLNAVGKLTISADGTVSTELLYAEDLAALIPDTEVKAMEDAWVKKVKEQLGEVIGYSEITLDNYDADGKRLVRKQSTNSGDFSADALYYLFEEMGMDVDVAVMNGGGIRNNALTGELSYLTCKEIHPFGNVACLLTVTGQQLLDMLEWGSKDLKADGSAEGGSFLHVSGARYTLDLSSDSTVQADDKDVWTGAPTGEYRVRNVQILNSKTGKYEPLNLAAEYHLAGYNYTLRDLGGGFAMLNSATNMLDYVAEDYMVLANYMESFPVDDATGLPTISAGSGYDNVNGSGRITIITSGQSDAAVEHSGNSDIPAASGGVTEYVVLPGDSLWKIAQTCYGSGSCWSILYEANADIIKNPALIYQGQKLRIPDSAEAL
ncbi:MAG: 5'-nucleotidase C-terminal domain-containing protein [Peptococcaceae bacterium]|nr:5'-nucleotidase C-terminal domain-containing protein [Peptococcaceae bacterium]